MAMLKPGFGIVAALLALGMQAMGQGPELTGRLSVSTVPDKATVTCDGILRDESPVTIDGLKPGPHLVTVEKAGYLPVSRTVSLVAGQRSAIEIPLERVTGLILFRSMPEGADIEINGAHRGTAPLMVADLATGKYRVKASSSGYLSREIEVDVEGRVPKLVEVSLVSDSARLIISSRPSGAEVTVDGLSKGATPCMVDRLPAGEHEVVVALADHEPYRSRVRLQANQEQAIDVPLKAKPAGISVISTPPNAKIYVDDKLKGVTPMTLENLEPGSHVLRVEREGYEPLSRTVEVAAGEKKVEDFPLARLAGMLQIMTKPAGANVFVDGKDLGVASEGDVQGIGKLEQVIPVGSHRVVIRLKGYASVERKVTVAKGETVSVKEVLKRVFIPDTSIALISGEVIVGILAEKLPGGDIKLETQFGMYKTIEGGRIERVEAIPAPPDPIK